MNDYLKQRNNTYISGQLTDTVSVINSTGAITIVENKYDNNGLVPNSYSIFLDKLFLASGYGFSSYSDYANAAYVINSYNYIFSYLSDEIHKAKDNNFIFKYSYSTENKFSELYNAYGSLISYKYFNVKFDEETPNSYELELLYKSQQYKSPEYFDKINLTYYYGDDNETERIFMNEIFAEPTASISVCYSFSRKSVNILKLENDLDIYINNNLINYDRNSNESLKGIYQYNASNIIQSKDLDIQTYRNNALLYHQVYKNAIKWRYKVMPFNGSINNHVYNVFNQLTLQEFDSFNSIFFNNSDALTLLDSVNASDSFNKIIQNYSNDFVYLDDQLNIEFLGDCYTINNELKYCHDYIIVKGIVDLVFYSNGFENNNWGKYIMTYSGDQYTIYQSPQKYIGSHTWTIKYKYG